MAVEGAGAALRIHGLLWVDGLSHAKSCRRALRPTLRVSSEKLLACASRCLGCNFYIKFCRSDNFRERFCPCENEYRICQSARASGASGLKPGLRTKSECARRVTVGFV